MRNIIRTLAGLACLLGMAFPAYSVTKQEMDQARTIAAQRYLRYANDMSGYLDDYSPKTMDELEGKLRAKEKENLKAFKDIPVPSDYASWDKEKLVAYWVDAVKNGSNLQKKGKESYNSIRNNLNEMVVAAPAAESPKEVAPAAPEVVEVPAATQETVTEAAEITADSSAALSGPEDTPVEENGSNTWTYVIILGILVIVVICLMVYASKALKKNDGGNRRESGDRRRERSRDERRRKMPRREAESHRREERISEPVRMKSVRKENENEDSATAGLRKATVAPVRETIGDSRPNESRALRMERVLSEREARIEQLEAELGRTKGELRYTQTMFREVKAELEEARAESGKLREELDMREQRIDESPRRRQSFHQAPLKEESPEPVSPRRQAAEVVMPAPEPVAPQPKPADVVESSQKPQNPSIRPKPQYEEGSHRRYMPGNSVPAARRTIFLGRVNSKGIFVRADRNFNPGNSFYRLVTNDGSTGTFTVVNDPSVWEVALVRPDDVLFNACAGPDLNDTYGRSEIITEHPGEAVFEDGAWRVTRKARISYL